MEQLLKVQCEHLRLDDMPCEILRIVFKLLCPRDLKAVVLVNKRFRDVGEDPSFWTWIRGVVIDIEEDIKMLTARRFQLLPEVVLSDGWAENGLGMRGSTMTTLFKAIDEVPTIRFIYGLMSYGASDSKGILEVEPNLVVRVLNRHDEVYLTVDHHTQGIQLTSEQMRLLFTAIAEKTYVEHLYLGYDPCTAGLGSGLCLSEISPELFGAALSNVKSLVLLGPGTSEQQEEALLSAILVEDKPLRILDGVHNWSIDPELMGRALNRLEDVEVSSSVEQTNAILKNLVDGESRLKKLVIGSEDFIDPILIRRAKDKLVNLMTMEDLYPC